MRRTSLGSQFATIKDYLEMNSLIWWKKTEGLPAVEISEED